MRFPNGETVTITEPGVAGEIDPYTGEPAPGPGVATTYPRVFVFRDDVAEDERSDRTSQEERYSVFFGEEYLSVSVSRHATVRLDSRGGIECKADGPSSSLRHPATGWDAGPVLKCVRVEG